MIKTFLRAVAIASFALVVTVAFVHAPARADDGLKLSRAVTKPMIAAQKHISEKDWPAAIAQLREVQAMEGKTEYDTFMVNTFLGVALFQSGDKKGATEAFIAAAAVPNLPPEKHAEAVQKAMMLIVDAKDYAKLVEFAKTNMPDETLTSTTATYLAISHFHLENDAESLKYAQKAVDLAESAGQKPDRDIYQVILTAQGHMKDLKAQIKTVQIMSKRYGTPEDWGRLIDISLRTLPQKSANLATAALFLYRLQLITKAETPKDDYQTFADLAIDQRSPGDAVAALMAAQAEGKTGPKTAATLAKAQKQAAADRPTLSVAETAATKSPQANMAVSVAEGYLGYKLYADAERMAVIAVAKNGPKQNEAYLVLGAAQAMQGKRQEAAATFAKVRGDSALESAAQAWIIYATRTYDAAPAPAAPASPAQ